MNSCELVLKSPNVYKIENPGVAHKERIQKESYSLEDVAILHLNQIKHALINADPDKSYKFLGMSMGGMILSILASEYRSELPRNSTFCYLVTSANTTTNPAVPDFLMETWKQAIPGNLDSFAPILNPFFSKSFAASNPDKVSEYVEYRALGKNKQSPKEFMRQLAALRSFDGKRYFARLNPSETLIVSGEDDYILGARHHQDLMQLVPKASHRVIDGLGHMVNIEQPELIDGFSSR